MELEVCIQHYDWGKVGLESQVAKLYKSANPEIEIKDIPYAELWMGTHMNGPCRIKATGELLSNVLDKNPEYLGRKSIQRFGNDLPFLFKVLSVSRALSIQAHPTKHHAEKLHAKRPDLYKDPNHKPELAIALTDFIAMCGFRPISEIRMFFLNVPELRAVVGEENAESLIKDITGDSTEKLQVCFTCMMKTPRKDIQKNLKSLLERIVDTSKCTGNRYASVENLIIRLNQDFPNDVGCFGPYFFNVFDLQPGQGLYLGPNEIHAYINGDCIECMACSDNIVRGGLTNKYLDVETLCDMLNYDGAPPEDIIFESIVENDFTRSFRPPVPDFGVAMMRLRRGKPEALKKRQVASILLCVEGIGSTETLQVVPGKVFFIPANDQFEFVSIDEDLLLFQGLANV